MKTMVAVVCGLLVVGGALAADKAADKKTPCEGTWTVAGMEKDGKAMTAADVKKADMKLIIKDDTYEMKEGDKTVDKGTFKLNTSKMPAELDIMPTEGENKGKTILALNEISGDTMKCCHAMKPGDPRPTAIKGGSGLICIELKRQK